MATVRLLGYWVADEVRRLPNPWQFVDSSWPNVERNAVVRHLERGTLVNQYRGLSRCRCCGRANGSAELTDGRYCWPEGLAHYVAEHGVRLPDEFVAHVRSSATPRLGTTRPTFDARGQRDRYWPQISPWGDSEPFNDDWWIATVRDFVESGGLVRPSVALPRPCASCGAQAEAASSQDRPYCCIEALALHLRQSSGAGGTAFELYRHAVLVSLAPPRIGTIDADISWWLDRRNGWH